MASCAMDVAQLAHLLLSKSEVRGLHPINDKIWERTYLLVTVKKTRIKKKSNDAGNGLFDKGQGFSGFRTQIVGVESKARLDQSFFICVKIRLFQVRITSSTRRSRSPCWARVSRRRQSSFRYTAVLSWTVLLEINKCRKLDPLNAEIRENLEVNLQATKFANYENIHPESCILREVQDAVYLVRIGKV